MTVGRITEEWEALLNEAVDMGVLEKMGSEDEEDVGKGEGGDDDENGVVEKMETLVGWKMEDGRWIRGVLEKMEN